MVLTDTFQEGSIGIRNEKATDGTPEYVANQS